MGWMSLWIELIFCMLTVMQYFLVLATLLLLSLTIKCQSTAIVLVSWLVVAGRILWNRVCPSFLPDIYQGVFWEFDHEISLNFALVLEIFMKLYMTVQFRGKTFFTPKFREMGQEKFFFDFKRKIWS